MMAMMMFTIRNAAGIPAMANRANLSFFQIARLLIFNSYLFLVLILSQDRQLRNMLIDNPLVLI